MQSIILLGNIISTEIDPEQTKKLLNPKALGSLATNVYALSVECRDRAHWGIFTVER